MWYEWPVGAEQGRFTCKRPVSSGKGLGVWCRWHTGAIVRQLRAAKSPQRGKELAR